MIAPPKVSLDAGAAELRLEFDDHAALAEFAESVIEDGGFMAPLDRQLKQHHAVRVHLALPDGSDFPLEAEVAQIFDSVTAHVVTAFVLSGWGEEDAEKLRDAVGGTARGNGEPAAAVELQSDEPDMGEIRGTSRVHDIRSMNVNQKTMLARQAGRSERQILLRETSPQVAMALLTNPRLQSKDVVRLVKSTHATAATLQRIAEDARWGKNQEILANVARNPKTPPPLATRLMDRLRTADLRMMAKMSSGMRDIVRRAALREYLRRTSK
ncbi:MAG: hypothetical protein OES47_09365 [Acidobacteriota bacterium]|nr:hypothetical protein [Acidobacteriota bacterium]